MAPKVQKTKEAKAKAAMAGGKGNLPHSFRV